MGIPNSSATLVLRNEWDCLFSFRRGSVAGVWKLWISPGVTNEIHRLHAEFNLRQNVPRDCLKLVRSLAVSCRCRVPPVKGAERALFDLLVWPREGCHCLGIPLIVGAGVIPSTTSLSGEQ